ncbi:MAG: hypothetical protein ABFC56_01380 [Clostridiaceae bacterium]
MLKIIFLNGSEDGRTRQNSAYFLLNIFLYDGAPQGALREKSRLFLLQETRNTLMARRKARFERRDHYRR